MKVDALLALVALPVDGEDFSGSGFDLLDHGLYAGLACAELFAIDRQDFVPGSEASKVSCSSFLDIDDQNTRIRIRRQTDQCGLAEQHHKRQQQIGQHTC